MDKFKSQVESVASLDGDELLKPLCALPGHELPSVRLAVHDDASGADGAVRDRPGVAVQEVDGVREVRGRAHLALLRHIHGLADLGVPHHVVERAADRVVRDDVGLQLARVKARPEVPDEPRVRSQWIFHLLLQ